MTWLWVTLAVVAALVAVATPILKLLKSKKDAGEAVGWLDVALAFAQGVDDAKAQLDPESKAKMTGALKSAAEKAGKHDDVTAFLTRFGFNKPTDQ